MRPIACLVAAAFIASACSPEPAPTPPSAHPSTAALHREVIAATNYDPAQVIVNVGSGQLVVTVINSNLVSATHQDRDADAARIAHTLETAIASRPELAAVQAIHVDYFASEEGKSPTMKDSMDFRRDASGRFKPDVS